MTRLRTKIFILLLAVYSFNARAVWFEGQGKAMIINGDVATARQFAIKDALLTLMYHGGASVNSMQVVKSGVLEIDKLTVRTNGEVVDMHLLTEEITDNKIQVTVSADIYPFDTCKKDNYSKSLFVGPFQLATPAQAQLGSIYKLPEQVSQRLFNEIRNGSRQLDARQVRTQPIAFNNNGSMNIENQMISVAQDISAQYDVQYILFGRINDLSDYNETSTTLLGLGSALTKYRNYQMQIYVIDAINKKTVFQKSYSASRPWAFDPTMRIDVTTNTFWYSDYGKLVNFYIDQSISDIENTIACETTEASVVAVHNNKDLVINLGQDNGVRRGDKFKLMRQEFLNFQDSGKTGAIFNPDDTRLEVISVQSQRALVRPIGNSDMANIQIRDVLAPVTDNDF